MAGWLGRNAFYVTAAVAVVLFVSWRNGSPLLLILAGVVGIIYGAYKAVSAIAGKADEFLKTGVLAKVRLNSFLLGLVASTSTPASGCGSGRILLMAL